MNSLRTKKKLKTRMPGLLPLVFLCLSVLFFSYTVTEFGFAQDDPETPAYSEEPNYLVDGDYIVVTGVANTVEYLTSLYLYVTDPKSATSVNMKYDPELNALLLNSSINANAMGIGFNEFGEGVVGSVFVGGSGNKITMRGQEVLDEYGDYTGTRNGKNDSAVAIGGVSNRPSSAGSVIIGGKNSSIGFTDSTMIGTVDSSLNGHTSVALGSRKSSLNVQDWNSVDMGYNNHGDKYTFLIGSGINTHGGSHWSAAVGWAFAYSPGNSGFALHGGNLGGQPGFYVNVKNGFGLNTSTPRLTFDFRSGGPLRVVKALGVQNNTMQFSEGGADGITCPDEVIVEKYRGTVAYVEHGGIGAFCGCNGKVWMPMSSDANEQALCAESKADARVCEGSFDEKTVIFHEETKGRPRWDEDANEGRGEWINLDWTYMGVPSLYSGDVRECSYTCAVGYHPDNKSAKGWFTGNCVACSELLNGKYISPGTGINDCEFACDGGYKYDKRAETEAGRCTPCRAGEWTEDLNQAMLCSQCELPVGISADGSVIYSGGVMWNGTTGTGEPYFRRFTSFSTVGEYGCDFECASGFMYSYDPSGKSRCLECPIGTFSPGGTYAGAGGTCAKCTNRNQPDIQFSHKDINGKTTNGTILAKDASWYTTKGKNGPDSCEWICNPKIGLVKDGASCKCPNGSHLESISGQPRCVSDIADVACTGALGSLAIKGDSIARGVSAGTLNGNKWEAKKYSWTYVNKPVANLGACEWTCPEDYTFDGVNNCTPPAVGKCGPSNGKLVDTLTDLCAPGSTFGGYTNLAGEIEINYYVDGVFQFYPSNTLLTNPAKYLAIWTCKGYDGKPKYDANCFAYVKGEAKKAQCPGEGQWRDASGKAQASCVYDTPNNCKEGLNCPPVMDKKDVDKVIKDESIDLDNVLPHGLMWNCPGTFGKEPTPCHSCDSGYSWRVRRGGCTLDEITTSCKTVSSSSLPSSRVYTNFGPESYTNTFDKAADNYTPGIKYYRRLSDGADPTNPCEWACQADTHFCSTRCELNPKCGSLQVDGSGNIIESYLCNIGSSSSVTTGSDGKFNWSCHNGCEYDYCGSDSYSCYGPVPDNTVYAGPRDLLYESAPYTLYPEGSSHLGEPCSLRCAYGYKYDNGSCIKIDNPKCGLPDKKLWDWRKSPEYCEEAFTKYTTDYYKCMSTAYNYCEVGDVKNFSHGGYIGASWTCDTEEKSVSCSAGCAAGTDNHNPYTLCLGSSDTNSDSIFIRYGKTLDYTGWDTSWLQVSRTYAGGLSGYGMMTFSGSKNTGASRSTTIHYSTNDDNYCENWDLTIYQCGAGEESYKENSVCRCVPKTGGYSCPTYGKPAHSVNVGPTNRLSVEPSQGYVLYENEDDAAGKPCSVVCEEDYTFLRATGSLPDRCEKCDSGKLNEDKTYCIVEVSCPEGYVSDGKGGCTRLGSCKLGTYYSWIPNNAVIDMDFVRPIGEDREWSCKRNQSSVTPHTCSFVCEEGYYCDSDWDCAKPECEFFYPSRYGDENIAMTYENPTPDLMKEGSNEVVWRYLSGVHSEQDFHNALYDENGNKKVDGCWYRCKNDKPDVSGIYPKCFEPNAVPDSYTCIGYTYGLADDNIIQTQKGVKLEDGNKNWTYVDSYEEYNARVAGGEQCLYTCNVNKGATLKHFSWGDYCSYTCPSDRIMKSWGYCDKCPSGQTPNTGHMEHGNALDCVDICNSDELWDSDSKACVAKGYYELKCPESHPVQVGTGADGSLICGRLFQ